MLIKTVTNNDIPILISNNKINFLASAITPWHAIGVNSLISKLVHDGFIIENRMKRELVKVMEDKWNKHWRIRGVRSSKPIIRETPHYTASNSPIRDIYDLFPEYL